MTGLECPECGEPMKEIKMAHAKAYKCEYCSRARASESPVEAVEEAAEDVFNAAILGTALGLAFEGLGGDTSDPLPSNGDWAGDGGDFSGGGSSGDW